MKIKLTALLVVVFLLPSVALAQSKPVLDQATLTLITSLLEKIRVLQIQLQALKSQEADDLIKTPYQQKVSPLVDELTENRKKQKNLENSYEQLYVKEESRIEKLNESFEDEDCDEFPSRKFRFEDRFYSCTQVTTEILKLEKEIIELKDDNKDMLDEIEDLAEEESELEEKIELLKTRYGV